MKQIEMDTLIRQIRAVRDAIDGAHGRWILHDVYCQESYECSYCRNVFVLDENKDCDKWLFCPNCGSKNKD